MTLQSTCEWIEADGLGGFASGTSTGIRTRRYHALLLTAATPPTGRLVLINGFDAWVETPGGTFALTSQRYTPDVTHPDGAQRMEEFRAEPWPSWTFRFEDGTQLVQEIFVPARTGLAAVTWRLVNPARGARLFVRPFLSGRDYHSMHKENAGFRFDAEIEGETVTWRPYEGVPSITAWSNGRYTHGPEWYRNFLYEEERARGLDDTEDLASPGVFEWDLSAGEAVWLVTTAGSAGLQANDGTTAVRQLNTLREEERRRRSGFASALDRAAAAYIVEGRHGKTIMAGYPWFTDWGRDTFIALRGLCLATGRLGDAREILLAWAGTVSEGMLPNRFPDHGEAPEYNAVDASLWFVIAAHEFLEACKAAKTSVSTQDRESLRSAIEDILEGYARGTRYGIRLDVDGLLAAGAPGVQLTWMDAKVGDWVVTPRIGKPVEVQALWLNALNCAARFSPGWSVHLERGLASFRDRFWDEKRGCLHDVVDSDHEPGRVDATFRPNQILAAGGLPLSLLTRQQALSVVTAVEARLWTPLGLRSLAPEEPGYAAQYRGGVRERDGVYHQGTVWPWLIGPFVEAWVRVRGNSAAAKREARLKFLRPLLAHLAEAGAGHVSEIADAESPHTPRGCPFQAWSVGELIRLDRGVLEPGRAGRRPTRELKVA